MTTVGILGIHGHIERTAAISLSQAMPCWSMLVRSTRWQSELAIQIEDRSLVSKYRFGTKTADFFVCSVCGVVPFVVCDIDENSYAVVNVNALEKTPGFSLSSSSTDFDGEDAGSRLERRQRNWIPVVLFNASAT